MSNIRFNCQIEFKLADMWIGVRWKRIGNCIDSWVCIIPCIPIHLSWWWHDENQE